MSRRSEDLKRALEEELARRESTHSRLVLHAPTERQKIFLEQTALEVMFGGAAGGGKSDALLLAALQYIDVPSYSALIIRRTYSDLSLPGAIMDRAKEWLIPQGVRWSEKDKRFTFPSGATLSFGYLDTEQDKYRYQGAAAQFIGVDELTQFPEPNYRYLASRMRRLEGTNVPIRLWSASNPGGVGHDWVFRRFVAPGAVGVFVSSKLSDNPYIDQASYRASLATLDSTTRRQLEDGEWIRSGEGLVFTLDEKRDCIEKLPEAA